MSFPGWSRRSSRQADFEKGYEELELSPSVDNKWHNVWEEFKAGAKATA